MPPWARDQCRACYWMGSHMSDAELCLRRCLRLRPRRREARPILLPHPCSCSCSSSMRCPLQPRRCPAQPTTALQSRGCRRGNARRPAETEYGELMLQIVCSKNQEVLDVLSESKMRAHKMQANSVAGEMVCRVHACICLGVHMTGLDFSLPFGVCLVIHRAASGCIV